MSSSCTDVLSIRRKVLTAVATLTCVAGVSAAAPGAARAATPPCGVGCISVFSSVLGNPGQPNFVEAVLDGGAVQVGQPVGLKPASRFDATLDIKPIAGTVSEFYERGLASAAANAHYGPLNAVQQEYAPFGERTGLCVGLARVAQNERLTLQPCSSPTTVWIPYRALASEEGYFPIVNAATTDFVARLRCTCRATRWGAQRVQMVARRPPPATSHGRQDAPREAALGRGPRSARPVSQV